MSQEPVGIIVDYERCTGCRACEIACMVENKNKGGWIRNVQIGPERVEGKLVRYFMTLMCMHCGDAPCMQVCPAKAISRKPNGIVLIDENLCIGCKFCLWAARLERQPTTLRKVRWRSVGYVLRGLRRVCLQHATRHAT